MKPVSGVLQCFLIMGNQFLGLNKIKQISTHQKDAAKEPIGPNRSLNTAWAFCKKYLYT